MFRMLQHISSEVTVEIITNKFKCGLEFVIISTVTSEDVRNFKCIKSYFLDMRVFAMMS